MVKKMENMALIPLPISLIKLLVKAQHQGGIPYSFRNYLEATMCLILCQALEWFCEYETIAVFKNVPSIGHKENIRHEPKLAQNLQRRGSSGRAKGIEMEPWVAQAGNYCSWCRTGTRLGWVLLFISVILVILSLGIWGIFFFFEEIFNLHMMNQKECQTQRPENFMSNHQQNHDNCPLPQCLFWQSDQNTQGLNYLISKVVTMIDSSLKVEVWTSRFC